MRQLVILVLVLSAVSATEVRGQFDNDRTRSTLAGLPGVPVEVGLTTSPECAKVNRYSLRTAGELALRRDGINAPTMEESDSIPGVPWLALLVITAPTGAEYTRAGCAFFVELALLQGTRLIRNEEIVAPNAVTWSAGPILGVSSLDQYDDAIMDVARDMFDQFVNAYLAANPR